ncbi:MAG: hypothetical protein EOP04_21060, partial [Proteobacteria bacterium]
MPRLEMLASLRKNYCALDVCDPMPIDATFVRLSNLFSSEVSTSGSMDNGLRGIQKLYEDYNVELTRYVESMTAPSDISILQRIQNNPMPTSFSNLVQKVDKFKLFASDTVLQTKKSAESYIMTSGLDFETLKSLMDLYEKRIGTSDTQMKEFLARRDSVRTQLLDSQNTEAQIASLLPQIEAKKQLANDLQDDLLSVQEAFRKAEAQKHQILQGLDSLPGVKFFEKNRSQREIDFFMASSADAKHQAGTLDTISELSKIGFKNYSLPAGSSVSFQIDGNWSPVCALKKSPVAARLGSTVGIQIGPEGMIVTQSDNKSKVQSVTDSRSRSSNQSTSLNGSVDVGAVATGVVGAINPLAGVAVAVVSNYISMTYGGSHGTSKDKSSGSSDTSSQGTSQSASFQDGLRLGETPFINFPAGALIAVKVPKGELSWRVPSAEFQVVNRSTTLLADRDSDIHLVVNDCLEAALDGTVASSALQIRVSENRPMEQVNKDFIATLGGLSKRYEAQA